MRVFSKVDGAVARGAVLTSFNDRRPVLVLDLLPSFAETNDQKQNEWRKESTFVVVTEELFPWSGRIRPLYSIDTRYRPNLNEKQQARHIQNKATNT